MTILFDAILTPHRSLSPQGFRRLMIFLACLLALPALYFTARGAWPIFGFCGAEFALLYYLFRRNYKDAAAHERVTVTPAELRIEKHPVHGDAATTSLRPTWVRVEMDPVARPGAKLHIASHGNRLELGSFLSAPEKADFATALGDALTRARTYGH